MLQDVEAASAKWEKLMGVLQKLGNLLSGTVQLGIIGNKKVGQAEANVHGRKKGASQHEHLWSIAPLSASSKEGGGPRDQDGKHRYHVPKSHLTVFHLASRTETTSHSCAAGAEGGTRKRAGGGGRQ